MIIEEIKNSTKLFLTASEVAQVLQCDPQCLRVQAQQDPSKLGYPIIVIGSRIRIPRIPFLKYLGVM